jgi:hypothetical protein
MRLNRTIIEVSACLDAIDVEETTDLPYKYFNLKFYYRMFLLKYKLSNGICFIKEKNTKREGKIIERLILLFIVTI